jgi:hypothetical protein
LVQDYFVLVLFAADADADVHKGVEKPETRFKDSVSAGSSIICEFHFRSFRAGILHQQSALTIIIEVFTFAPVDG